MSAAGPPAQADENFGRRLRRERERRQIPLASIADNSKIKVSLFEELERNDVSRWPSGVFRRAFIRAYADAVGLDPDATAREFLERFPDPNDPDRATSPASPSSAPTLRLTFADTGRSFSAGRLLSSVRSRLVAIACDAAIVIALGLTFYLVLGTLWMPLCLTLAGYYCGGILLLGNTPGVCLCASNGRWIHGKRSTPRRRANEPQSSPASLRSANA